MFTSGYETENGQFTPIATIYKITNKHSGMCYIGQTMMPVMLRWQHHFYYPSDSKFGSAIKEFDLRDWTFEVLESVKIPVLIKTLEEMRNWITAKEMHYIYLHDSINRGYNTVEHKVKVDIY